MSADDHTAEFKRCLEALDVPQARRLWAHVNPHLPQPQTDEQMLVMLHHARTLAESLPVKARAYSHAWLRERGLPSGLPDRLKASAERLYPVVVGVVGISVNMPKAFSEVATEVRGAMEHSVLDTYADGVTDPAIVKPRMFEARAKAIKQLVGRLTIPH